MGNPKDTKKQLHKDIEKSDFSKDEKKKLHELIKKTRRKLTIVQAEDAQKLLTSLLEEKPTPPKPKKPTTKVIPKKEREKADVTLTKKEMPENCYLEINCEGKNLTVDLPEEATPKPIRIRPQGTGTLTLRLSRYSEQTHEIDRSQLGYKFTDFHWQVMGRSWTATDKFDSP